MARPLRVQVLVLRDCTPIVPVGVVDLLRKTVELSRALEQSREPVVSIASRVGYADAVAFRKLFARLTGLTPSDYRERYGPRAAPGFVTERRVRGGS